jgi:hypothetical protein
MPGTTSDPLFVAKSIWGVLYRDGKATTRWKRFLSDIAGDLVSKSIAFAARPN